MVKFSEWVNVDMSLSLDAWLKKLKSEIKNKDIYYDGDLKKFVYEKIK